MWQARYGGDRQIVGRTIHVNGVLTEVVGILPAGFGFPLSQELWLPLRVNASSAADGAPALDVLGRLKPRTRLPEARSELTILATRHLLVDQGTKPSAGVRAEVRPLVRRYVSPQAVAFLGVMLLAVSGVLVIACANVAHLLLARAVRLERELALRLALGATRGRLVGDMLWDAGALAALGTAGGLVVAIIGVRWVRVLLVNGGVPPWAQTRIDVRVTLFAVALGALSTLLAVLLPALRATRGRGGALVQDSHGTTSVRVGRLSRWLVVGEIAISCALLIPAGLATKSLLRVNQLRYGFAVDGVFVGRVHLNQITYSTDDQIREFHRRLAASLATLAEIDGAAVTTELPGWLGRWATVDFDRAATSSLREIRWSAVTPDFFRTFEIPLLRGRGFTETDNATGTPVAVVSAAFAQRNLAGGEPIGQRIRFGSATGSPGLWRTIVGVVADVIPVPGVRESQAFYVPFAQQPTRDVLVAVRTGTTRSHVIPAVRRKVAALDVEVPLYQVGSLRSYIDQAATFHRASGGLLCAFAAGALLLATIGTYGVVTFSVRRRTREIGIRIALGASPMSVGRLILFQSARQVATGIAAGVLVGGWLGMSMRIALFGVAPLDPGVVGGSAVLLLGVACAASWRPIMRAIRVDPMETLRVE